MQLIALWPEEGGMTLVELKKKMAYQKKQSRRKKMKLSSSATGEGEGSNPSSVRSTVSVSSGM